MSKIAVLCNDGVEEIECLTVVDFCRRAGIEVITVSVTGKRQIMGAHQIVFHADEVYADMNFDEFDGIVYPGEWEPAQWVKNRVSKSWRRNF